MRSPLELSMSVRHHQKIYIYIGNITNDTCARYPNSARHKISYRYSGVALSMLLYNSLFEFLLTTKQLLRESWSAEARNALDIIGRILRILCLQMLTSFNFHQRYLAWHKSTVHVCKQHIPAKYKTYCFVKTQHPTNYENNYLTNPLIAASNSTLCVSLNYSCCTSSAHAMHIHKIILTLCYTICKDLYSPTIITANTDQIPIASRKPDIGNISRVSNVLLIWCLKRHEYNIW